MSTTPEWISVVAPFVSGAFGIGLGWGIIRQQVHELNRRITKAEERLECQVGDLRCNQMREECKKGVADVITRIETRLSTDSELMNERFLEIARFMGKHNGRS